MSGLSGIRARIVLVAVVVVAPLVGLQLWQASGNRERALAQATSRVTELARLAASEEDDSLQEAANLLRVLKQVPVVAGAVPDACHAFLREITNGRPKLQTVSVLGADGAIACTSLGPVPLPKNMSDREWFREVMQPDAPSTVISEFLVSRTTGQPTVVVSTPLGRDGPARALASTMDLAWFSEIATRLPGSRGATVLVVDAHDGNILARSPPSREGVPQKFFEDRIIDLFRSSHEGATQATFSDGIARLIGFKRLPGDLRSNNVVVVCIPVAEILADADIQLRDGLAAMLVMLVAGMAMSWVLASYSIIRPLNALGHAAIRLGNGDVTAQATMSPLAAEELDKLAGVFNRAVAQIANRGIRLEQLAMQDALTGLPNRRVFDAALALAWAHAIRSRRPMALIMIDVDDFKRYNDSYGHPAGDICLRTVATAIEDTIRQSSDTAARYGGEEFAIILPDTDLAGAERLAERLVRRVDALGVPHKSAASGRLSISAGVADIEPALAVAGVVASAQWLLAAADSALYQAKQAGRGRAASFDMASGVGEVTLAA